jgi:hypothetical protein
MKRGPNNFVQTAPVCTFLSFLSQRPGAPDDDRSPEIRAERGELWSCKDDAIIAQGKRGTSAALGERQKRLGWVGGLPRAAASAVGYYLAAPRGAPETT